MATAPSNPSPTQQHSPRAAVEGSATSFSPSRRRGGGGASPWTQFVRGGGDLESTNSSSSSTALGSVPPPPPPSGASQEQIMTAPSDRSPPKTAATAQTAASTPGLPEDGAAESQPEGSENGSGGTNASKKPAWNKPSNGGTEVGPVMGAVSWPALSESTRASPKSSSDSLKTLSDSSASASQTIQGTGIAPPSPNKQGTNNNASPNSTPNHASYIRQRSIRRNSGNSSNNVSANGGFSQVPSPRGSSGEMAPNSSGKHGNSGSDSTSRDNTHRDAGQRGGFGSQSHGGNDHQQQRSTFRRGNGGSHPRGDGSHHHGYGGRRGDPDRGNQDWNHSRGFGGRDGHLQSQRVPSRPLMRGPAPPAPAPFITGPPIPVRPFGGPIVYPDVPSPVIYVPGPHPESVRAVPLIPPMAPMFYAYPDPQLHTKIVNQIDYYFSNENLIKDTFLRQNMDDQGWVPIKLIASFKKVMQLTDNIQLILDAVRSSTAVEVEGEKVRRRNDWMRWIMPPSVQYSTISSPQSVQKSIEDKLSANLQSVTLDDKTPKHSYGETYISPSSSGEWSSYSQQSSGEKASQGAVLSGFSTSAANASK